MDPTRSRLLHEYGHTDTQRYTPLLEHTTLPMKLANILICYFLVVGGQMDGVDLVVGVDFSKTNYHFLPVSNLVSKCWISPKATTPQKKPNAGPLPAIVRKKQPVGDYPRNCFALDWWRTLAPHSDLGHEKRFWSNGLIRIKVYANKPFQGIFNFWQGPVRKNPSTPLERAPLN